MAGEKSKRPGGNLKPNSQDHPVGRPQGRPLDLPVQNGDLVPERKNLEVPFGV